MRTNNPKTIVAQDQVSDSNNFSPTSGQEQLTKKGKEMNQSIQINQGRINTQNNSVIIAKSIETTLENKNLSLRTNNPKANCCSRSSE